jgi:anhydro-N-acetylmuramic acid kinase
LRTTVEHIARQVARALRHAPGRVLVTGGGAHNRFLLERIAALSPVPLGLPDKATIDQKEAVIFALLGLLRWLGRPNALATVTGASHNSVGGAVYLPN